jgi:chemotaxis signal transduction protein
MPDAPLADDPCSAETIAILLLRVAGQSLAIRLSDAAEILPLPELTRLPDAPPILKGVFHLGPELVLVLPMADLLGLAGPAEGIALYHHLLLIPRHEGRTRLAFLVDRVVDITEAPSRLIPGTASYNECVEGDLRHEGTLIPLIALPRLLAAREEARLAAFAARARLRAAAFVPESTSDAP